MAALIFMSNDAFSGDTLLSISDVIDYWKGFLKRLEVFQSKNRGLKKMPIKTLAENILISKEDRIKAVNHNVSTVFLEIIYEGGRTTRTVLKNLDEAIELCSWMNEDELETVAEIFAKRDGFDTD